MPRWVEPDPPDDGEGDTGDAGEAARGPTVSEDLNTKPVLEWTNDDWARWIDSADTYLPPREPAEEPAAEPGAQAEREAEAAAFEPEPVAQDEVRADVTDLEPWAEDVFDDLEPTGEWILDPEPPPPVETVDPAPSTESTGPWTEKEWAAVAEHPWWESAPEPDPATARVVRLPVPEEPAAEPAVGEPPTSLPPPPLEPVVAAEAPPSPAPRITRPRPAVRGSSLAPARMVADTTHRVRSAFGLLGVSLLIGTVTAGLITVIVFALSLALRRAVG